LFNPNESLDIMGPPRKSRKEIGKAFNQSYTQNQKLSWTLVGVLEGLLKCSQDLQKTKNYPGGLLMVSKYEMSDFHQSLLLVDLDRHHKILSRV